MRPFGLSPPATNAGTDFARIFFSHRRSSIPAQHEFIQFSHNV
ncbi:Hypothetical protein, conserved [Brucella canis ATCC 23365]|uniref:Uncharacterized protein n=1 Tax=Brucella canis (strain ATCC 23365 / NCTC 10854 / RM-666) TaxID=483179 RepID=A9MCM5_BRUC2|nr:Hypothetical protein, conserved [Brucella canis ATCC 23365]AEW16214.1 Serine/threonine protein kinase [Brucella canis HSK A52141]